MGRRGILVALIILNAHARARALPQPQHSPFAHEDFRQEMFLKENEAAESTDGLSEPEDPVKKSELKTAFEYPTMSPSSFNEKAGEREGRTDPEEEEEEAVEGSHATDAGVFPETRFLHRLSQAHRDDDIDEEENREGDPTGELLLARREARGWRESEESPAADGIPWHYDVFYPHEYHLPADSLQDSREENHAGSSEGPPEILRGSESKIPQYYQKNYYYNYYPFLNAHKYYNLPPEAGEEGSQPRYKRPLPSLRKSVKKSTCRQYLDFLKYAFERLNESPEYTDEYFDDYPQREGSPPKTGPVFVPQLSGPTLYVDNSKSTTRQQVGRFPPEEREEGLGTDLDDPPATEAPTTTTTTPAPPSPYTSKTLQLTPHSTPPPTHPETTPSEGKATSYSNGPAQWRQRLVTSLRTETDSTVSDYDYNEIRTTIAAGYQKLGNAFQKTPERDAALQSNTSLVLGTPRAWISHSVTVPTTVFFRQPPQPSHSPGLRLESVTADPPVGDLRKEEGDCNDKTLPCPDTYNVTYPLNGYCNRYVSCESGRAIRRTCADGLHFNIVTKSCDLPHNSFCTYVCPQPNGLYGIPGDCGGYFVCENSVAEYRMCPPRMHWDVTSSTCTFAESSACPMKCSKAHEVKPYGGDCKAYVICLQGVPYYHKCPPKTRFDEGVLTCVPDHLSKCEDDPRLLTKTLNPNFLCRNFEAQLGTEGWCNYFKPNDSDAPARNAGNTN